jgi:hypothetical protein
MVYPTLPVNVSELVRITVPPVFATIRLDSQSVSRYTACSVEENTYAVESTDVQSY